MAKPTIQQSVFDCFLIIQKIEEWRTILQRVKADPSLKRNQLEDIQKKIGKISDIIYQVHKSAKWADEVVSKLYYATVDELEELRRYFESNGCQIDHFIKDDRVKRLLNDLPFDTEYSLKDKAEYVARDSRPSELAIEFTARRTDLSEARLRKKIKKIYQK